MPYYTYILASRTKRLYIGVTNDLERAPSPRLPSPLSLGEGEGNKA